MFHLSCLVTADSKVWEHESKIPPTSKMNHIHNQSMFHFYINTTLSAVQAHEALQLNPTSKSRCIFIFSSSQRAEVHTNTKEGAEHLNLNGPNFPSS